MVSESLPLSVLIDTRFGWRLTELNTVKCWHIGSDNGIPSLLALLEREADMADLRSFLQETQGNYAFIAETRTAIIGAVDKIRSYPVFYFQDRDGLSVSNSARMLREEMGRWEVDPLSLLEFSMSGYVTGKDTLCKGLCQLQSGESLWWQRNANQLIRDRYFLYLPEKYRTEDEETLVEKFNRVNQRVFSRIIDEARGREIWVPLSGGLDSRFVLCKLHELGCENLKTFSYGPPGNYEAKAARRVARTLGVPWRFIPSKRNAARRFFDSRCRKEYWAFSDGLCCLPFMQDLETILFLVEEGGLPEDAIIINGQSGDFITGGHLPGTLIRDDCSVQALLDSIISKHFSLWSCLKTPENLERINNKIMETLESTGAGLESPLSSLYELWEWQERQCKYVVNGQRVYDFLNLSWRLPLWDSEYLDFWKEVPAQFKAGQHLYLKYLERYDYRSLFKEFSPKIWRWPGSAILFVPVARLAGLLFGQNYKKQVYRYAGYLGHYRAHFAPYSLAYYLKNISKARGAVSFYVDTWCVENGLSSPI
jgi:asparagine synthase (glutamine-hydrolysing)